MPWPCGLGGPPRCQTKPSRKIDSKCKRMNFFSLKSVKSGALVHEKNGYEKSSKKVDAENMSFKERVVQCIDSLDILEARGALVYARVRTVTRNVLERERIVKRLVNVRVANGRRTFGINSHI